LYDKCFYLIQVQLYEDFARSRAKKGVEDTVSHLGVEETKEKKVSNQGTTHVFQV